MNECVQYEIIQHKATINVVFYFIFQKKKKTSHPTIHDPTDLLQSYIRSWFWQLWQYELNWHNTKMLGTKLIQLNGYEPNWIDHSGLSRTSGQNGPKRTIMDWIEPNRLNRTKVDQMNQNGLNGLDMTKVDRIWLK